MPDTNAAPGSIPLAAAELMQRIETRDAIAGIIGLGYVGLPLALAVARAGHPVLGFDIDAPKVEALNQGRSPLRHIGDAAVAAALATNAFEATADFDRLEEVDLLLICVPTPLSRHREPDLSFVEGTARAIARRLRRGQMVVLESTTWPGTTLELVKPILEATGLASGLDFFLAYSPEREDPGNPVFTTAAIPKVVGGDGRAALDLACAFYAGIVSRVVPVSSAATAEAVKLTENVFRAVNIALVNELKTIYDAMGIDVWEVIEAASTKPFGFMPFQPGPGLGGHCIPIDPFYLTWKAREYGINTRFIELAGEVNTLMPRLVVDKLAQALDHQAGRGLNRARILLLGMAYKRNVDDLRESPSLVLTRLLEARGARVDYHDPHVPEVPRTREHPELAGRRSVPADAESVARYDAVLVATDHDAVDHAAIARAARLVVDTRNACARAGVHGPHIVKA
jgi:UDP-N-acetyl-D-glucosamine dehydrogenase